MLLQIVMSFENSVTITTGFSDFRKMVNAVPKTVFEKLISKKKIYMKTIKALIGTTSREN